MAKPIIPKIMTKTAAIIISPDAQIRGAFPNIPKIFKFFGFRCLILVSPTNNVIGCLPDNVEFYRFSAFRKMKNIIPRLPRLLRNIIEQILVTLALVNIREKVDLFLFSHVLMPIPTIVLKFLKRKILLLVGGISYLSVPDDEYLIKMLTYIVEDMQYRVSDIIAVVSKGFVYYNPLKKYSKKILEGPIRLLDATFYERFRFSPLSNRENAIGFIGRFSWEKGIIPFMDAMHIVYSKRQDVCFFIIGDGPLKDLVVEKLRPYILCGRVTLLSWVANVEKYISTVKLLVIPSKIEGEPQIMIEAMSCGTPVLATPVGAIPSIIKDGVNGFLLKSDDHKHIADTILELLDKQDLLEKVSVNAYNYIKENFSYEKTLEAWRKILHELELE